MTKKLYHVDQYLTTFAATVLARVEVAGKPGLILDQTAFYPTSGGQPHDLGTLNDTPVLDVIENDASQIIHVLAQPLPESSVEGRIDWARRFDHIQQHTGQHLLSQAFIRICGAETVSFHLSPDVSTIDVNQPGIGEQMVNAVEELANQIIYENRAVMAHVVQKEEVARFPVRKMPVVEDNIRIIEIKDFDFSPCGGTHCAHVGELGMIKIRKWEAYKGGARIQFVCGRRALRDYRQKTVVLKQLTEMFSSGETDLPPNLGKFQEELKTLRREAAALTKQLLEYEALALVNEREQCGGWLVLKKIFAERNPNDLKILAYNVLAHSPDTIVLFGSTTEGKAALVFVRSEGVPADMNRLMKTACAVINGKGGGQPHQAQGGGANAAQLAEALQRANEAILGN